ncbi:MAG: protein kinase, partial [Lentisphaeraceae bacterium]|nr:protein kinase [Lentisphaeraceae bacterium]
MSETADGEYKKIGQYPLIKQIGKGGMGSVWYSEHPYLKIPCAIKIMDTSLAKDNPEFVQRFIQEGRLAAAISHPNVLKVYDANHEGDCFYMVLEYIDGCDIKQLAQDRGGKLPPDEVVEIAHAIGDALRQAYDTHQIIHRDIKPENILINQQGELKLADLGIGKQINDDQEFNLTMTGVAIGTAYYISPEQAMDSKHIDNRSDIYSLGATLYKLLTGDYPFTARTITAMMMKHANEPLENPQLKDPTLPDNLCAVICKMMQKKPEDRYNSYTEFLDDINAIRNSNAPLESLTCATEGIGPIEKEKNPEPQTKKKMHISKSAQKQAEKLSHTAHVKPETKVTKEKKSKVPLYVVTAAVLILVPFIMILMNKKEVQKPEPEVVEVQKPEPEKKIQTAIKAPTLPKAAVIDVFSSAKPTNENVSIPEPPDKLNNNGIIANLEKQLTEANGAEIEVKDFKMDKQRLTALDLSDNENLKDISPLKGLPLTYLNLNNCPNLKSLNGIQDSDLHELSLISSRPMELSNLEPLKGLPLQILKIYKMPLLNNLDPLTGSGIKTLYLVDCPNLKSLQPLSESRNLNYLEISNKEASSLRSLNGLERLPLRNLIIENCPQVRSLRPILDSPLEDLTIRRCGVPESELNLLFELPLKRIDSGNKEFDDRYWAYIENGRKPFKNPEFAINNAENPFAGPVKQPFPPKANMQENSYGDLQINSLVSGELFIDGKKYADITAKKTLSIPQLKSGDIRFELKTDKGNVEGIWEVEAGQMNKGLIPNSKLAYSANGLSFPLVSKYMLYRIRAPKKPASPFTKQIDKLTEQSLAWFLENRNEHGVWGNEDAEVLTALVSLCFLTDRSNLYNANSHILDKSIGLIAEAVRKYEPRQMEEYPLMVLALTEAYALTKSKLIERDVATGVQRLLKSQGDKGSFDAHNPNADKHNLIYSPWVYEALKTAYLAGIYQSEIKKAFNDGSKLIIANYTKGPRSEG